MTQSTKKNGLIKIGDFFFKWRNYVFPVIILCLFVPFHPPGTYFGSTKIEEIKDVFAITIILSGLAFRSLTIGWAYIKRGGLNKEVYADKLVREGFFGLCRNPLYVGNLLVYLGIFMLHGHPVVVVLGTSLYVFIYIAIIAAEEHYLRNKFGAAYEDYCNNVARWIPDFSKYKESTRGMDFKIRRSLFKDYTTIFNAIFAIAVIELLEHFTFNPRVYESVLIAALCGLSVAAVMLVCVRTVKKTSNVKI